MSTIIRKAVASDVENLSLSLVRSFDNDPFINWFVRQDDKRLQGFNVLFRSCLNLLSLPYGEVLTSDDCSGGALWIPSENASLGIVRQLFLLPSLIRVASMRGLKKIIKVMDTLDKVHPKEKHYYLQFIGVDPGYQGKGLGASMIKPVLSQCDQKGIGAYLENTKEDNIGYYEKFGFVVVGEINLGKGAPPVWQMWRSPQ